MPVASRLIKKYKNRRLYDTDTSQYITVDDLRRYVVDGLLFRVEDSTNGQDITNATLLQIFVEMEAGSTQFLSSDTLRHLILLAHHPMHNAFKVMMEQAMASLQKQGESNAFFADLHKASDAWNKQTQQLMAQWQDLFKP